MTLLKSGSRGDLPSSSSSTSASAAESSSSQSSTKAGRGQQRGGRGGGGGCSSSCADKPRNSESSASGLVEEEEEASVSASCSGSGSGSPPVSPRTDAVSQHFNNGHTSESLDGEALPVVMDNRNSGGGRIMTSSWAQRMHRRAATLGTVVTSCGHPSAPYPRRIEKVKFGVPVDEVCKNDIPGPLLVLILKLNKEAPYKKDVFRAPGHQGNMKKLIHFLQNGRLVNIDNFSVYTIASVLKKFLRKLPDGIFGRDGEQQLFQIIEMTSTEQQRDHIHSLISTLPVCTQRLIVLLFGTFRVIASNSERYKTGMTSEALGVSVAPSFFQSCVSDGKQAKMEDVMRFKVATKIMKFLIDNFGVSNLFGRENYEYYARITGRILKVEEDWIFSFRYPPDALVSRQESLEAEKTWLQYESERWGLNFNLEAMSHQEESHSTPALIQASDRLDADTGDPSSSLSSIPENNLLESYTRLSISLEDNGLFKVSEVLEEVHERQAARMKTRSEWFLSPSTCPKMPAIDVDLSNPYYVLRDEAAAANCYAGGILSSSNESVKHPPIRRTSSKEKDRRLVRRSSSKKNKENGAAAAASSAGGGSGGGGGGGGGGTSSAKRHSAPNSTPSSTTIVDSNHQLSSPPSSGDGTIGGGGGELDEGGGVEGGATPGTSLSPPPVTSTPGDKVPTPSRRSNASNLYDCDRPSGTPPTEGVGGTAGGAGGANVSVAGAGIAGAAGGPTNGIAVDGSSASDHATLVSELDCTETDVQTFHVTLTYKPRI